MTAEVPGPAVVGRLLDLLHTSRGGTTVLVTGLPGIGKSTALGWVADRLAAQGTRVRRTGTDGMSRSRPFGLVGGLLGVDPGYPPRHDVADRLVEAVEELCAGGPVLLCADDLHLADGDSLTALGLLAGTTRDLPLSLLLARRPLPVRDGLTSLAARPDVAVVELTGLDDRERDALVAARCGAPPGPGLRPLLDVAGGNPFHVEALLEDLRRRGVLAVADGVLVASALPADPPESVQAVTRAHLALLDPAARDLLQVLAAWGRPARPEQLADVTGAKPASLLGPVQSAVGSGVAAWTDDGLLRFRHDLYRDVLLADLDPPLRRMLHAACAAELRAGGASSPQVLQQSAAAEDPADPAVALQVATVDLAHAPAQAADLLEDAAARAGDAPPADAIAVARTGALAAAGRMAEADRVAREWRARTRDPATRVELARLALHQTVSVADVDGALVDLDAALAGDLPAPAREAMTQLRRWVVVLGGREPVGDAPAPSRTGAALLPTAIDRLLAARCVEALELADAAVRAREERGSPAWSDGASAPVFPAWISLYGEGVEQARRRSVEARRLAQERGHGWLMPLHLFTAAGIDYHAGRWDDAVAQLDSGVEAAAVTGTGWLSRPIGMLGAIRVRRGELTVAAAELDRWKVRGLPEQFGLPMVAFAELLLAEAQGRAGDAGDAARRVWSVPLRGGRAVWTFLAGPDLARIAQVTGDGELLHRVAADTARVPVDQVPTLAPAADLVRAVAEGDPDRAMAAAAAFRSRGNVLGELGAWEEAAVASAARGDTERARRCTARCVTVAGALGAVTHERRLTARLRAHSVRLGVTGRRRRPATGWKSLTPTELKVVELVGQGMTSPQIAGRLYLSPRTVQTHVSHCLRKLGLSSRVELATTLARMRV